MSLEEELFKALQEDNIPEIVRLIEVGADVMVKDGSGRTPLHLVRSKEAASVLIAAGADVEAKSSYGETPLILSNNGEVAELLITKFKELHPGDRNALLGYIEARETSGSLTALHVAETASVASLLISLGADVNAINSDEETPLHFASPQVFQVLILAGADVNLVKM